MTDMDDPIVLKAEVARLRDLLIENDIDPDPRASEPERFGPPTEFEWRNQRMFAKTAAWMASELARRNVDREFFSCEQWTTGKVGSTLRIRIPVNYIVSRNKP